MRKLLYGAALILTFYLYLSGGQLWLREDRAEPRAVENCCPAALPETDRRLLQQGLTADTRAEAAALVENFCS